jgi:hypothetical protein
MRPHSKVAVLTGVVVFSEEADHSRHALQREHQDYGFM